MVVLGIIAFPGTLLAVIARPFPSLGMDGGIFWYFLPFLFAVYGSPEFPAPFGFGFPSFTTR